MLNTAPTLKKICCDYISLSKKNSKHQKFKYWVDDIQPWLGSEQNVRRVLTWPIEGNHSIEPILSPPPPFCIGKI